jgi:hypothetical protein
MQTSLLATPLQSGSRIEPVVRQIHFASIALVAFALYWLSANVIDSRGAAYLFHSDAVMYRLLADANVIDRLGVDPWLDRITRFHPVTTGLANGWMKVLGILTPWIAPAQLLKAMFAAVGAIGVWAALWAIAAVVPHRYVTVLGAIYATSLGVWYFSSIEESKIVTATLTALYIAAYLHLRRRWTPRGAVLLTAILLVACLNEIVAGFLVVIPVVDTLMERGWDLRHSRWIAWHGLAPPVALLFLEGVVNGHVVAAGTNPEGASHLSMLRHYLANNGVTAAAAYSFFVNWLFFNIAAPGSEASHVFPEWPEDKFFDPVLAGYFSSPVSAILIALLAVIVAAGLLPRSRADGAGNATGLLLAFGAFALLRGAFFLVVYPKECLLFASGVTLAHVLVVAILFTASSLPAKKALLAAFALLLFINNGGFIIGG